MDIELNLDTIKKNAFINEDENWRFRSYLKGKDSDRIDEMVHDIYDYVIKHVDCSECANCCIVLDTSFEEEEFDHLCQSKDINREEFVRDHTRPKELGDEDKIYLKDKPCMFLKDKKCTIYELRPEECQSYPHIHKDGFIFRLWGVVDNYAVCPIVYNVYEMLKQRFHYR